MSDRNPIRNICLVLRYDGTAYHGWQSQKNALSVQDILQNCIRGTTGQPLLRGLYGCGRTDAGVHAMFYVANFHSRTGIPADKLPFALNAHLPPDVRVMAAIDAPPEFHARFSCTEKEYLYRMTVGAHMDPFRRNVCMHVPLQPDVAAMQAAAAHFVGRHDFSAFRNMGSAVRDPVRTVTRCAVEQCGDEIRIAVAADGFLYNMVRVIAGTLLTVGKGKLSPDDIPALFDGRRREDSGMTAPPQGLALHRIWYRSFDFAPHEMIPDRLRAVSAPEGDPHEH